MSSDAIEILQFSDTHLFADPAAKICGLKTEDSFQAVLEAAQKKNWPPHFILATGDIAQDYSAEAYTRFRERFEALKIPVYCLPGNHDDAALIKSIFVEGVVQAKSRVIWDDWQVLLLNSAVPRKNGGHLFEDELTYLNRCLELSKKHALVCLHHNPVPAGSAWLDTMMVDNASGFFNIIDKFSHVKGVLWGHVHQEFDGERNGVKLMASPSTSIQFKPKTEQFKLDDASPGYRWIKLFPDGSIKSGVERAETFVSTIDFSSSGY